VGRLSDDGEEHVHERRVFVYVAEECATADRSC